MEIHASFGGQSTEGDNASITKLLWMSFVCCCHQSGVCLPVASAFQKHREILSLILPHASNTFEWNIKLKFEIIEKCKQC